MAQILLDDVDRAVEEIEPIWATLDELALPLSTRPVADDIGPRVSDSTYHPSP